MFGLMKNLIKETTAAPLETLTLAELYAGCVLGFGFVPQKNISGKRISVAEVNSYLFDEDNFIVYKLEGDYGDINLIVASEDEGPGNYLALSQRIEPRQFGALFGEQGPESWFSLEEGDPLDVNADMLGTLSGWLVSEYTLAVATRGRFFEGDYRLRKPQDRARLSKPFDYVLLVDEDNEYALEAEKYEDGTISVLATVYRPSTDIGEIARAPKTGTGSLTSSSEAVPMPVSYAVEKIAHEPPTLPAVSVVTPAQESPEVMPESKIKLVEKNEKTDEAVISAETASVDPDDNTKILAAEPETAVKPELTKLSEEVVAPKVDASAEGFIVIPSFADALKESGSDPVRLPSETPAAVKEEPERAKPSDQEASNKALAKEIVHSQDRSFEMPPLLPAGLEDAAPARSKFGRIQYTGSQEQVDTLAFDLPVAARLIDEAQRNHMPISEVIRKVIDLPAQVNDQILIPFALDASEQAELARRYQLPPHDREAVKEQIVEELRRFAGSKK